MDVFVSWSGSVSRAIAAEFSEFLGLVIQRSNPWFSDKTQAGAEWWRSISERLGKSDIGVLFVTQDNKNSNWLLFEAGAIAKGVAENRVCLVLVDLKNEDIKPPLSLFQANPLTKDGIFRVLQTVNEAQQSDKFTDERLRRAMDAYWEDFDTKVQRIIADGNHHEAVKPRSDRELLVEVLETVRGLDQRVLASEDAIMKRASVMSLFNGQNGQQLTRNPYIYGSWDAAKLENLGDAIAIYNLDGTKTVPRNDSELAK